MAKETTNERKTEVRNYHDGRIYFAGNLDKGMSIVNKDDMVIYRVVESPEGNYFEPTSEIFIDRDESATRYVPEKPKRKRTSRA